MEVAGAGDDLGAVLRHALHVVSPPAGGLHRGLDGLRAGVHRQDHLHAAELGQAPTEGPHLVVVERPAGQGQLVELGVRGGDQRGVAMAEVEGGVRRQHVEVTLALDVGDPRTSASATTIGRGW